MIYLLADLHANLSALKSVFRDMNNNGYDKARDKVIILGDIVDYGLRPNEVIDFILNHFKNTVIIEGNHENAILKGGFDKFASDAARQCSDYTRSILTEKSLAFLENQKGKGKQEITAENKRVLLIHGSKEDCYWGRLDTEVDAEKYRAFDMVLSAHSHKRHLFTKYVGDDNTAMRNRRAVLFCNPGSVGQPRNHITRAQYCFCDDGFENFSFRAVEYDIASEQSLWNGEIDIFYRDRLSLGV